MNLCCLVNPYPTLNCVNCSRKYCGSCWYKLPRSEPEDKSLCDGTRDLVCECGRFVSSFLIPRKDCYRKLS